MEKKNTENWKNKWHDDLRKISKLNSLLSFVFIPVETVTEDRKSIQFM